MTTLPATSPRWKTQKIDWEDRADGDARSVLDEPMSDELEELAELAEEAMHM